MFCSLIPNASKLKIGILIAFLVTSIVTAYFLIPAIARADTDVTPSENTAQIVSVNHVVSPVTTNIEATTHELTPLTFPAEPFSESSDLTWLYTGVVIGFILITATGLVIIIRRKRRRILTPLLIFLLGLAILTAIPTTAFAQTLTITSWTSPVGEVLISNGAIDSAGKVWFTSVEKPQKIGCLDPATNEYTLWALPLPAGGYYSATVDGNDNIWFHIYVCPILGNGDGVGQFNPSTNLFTIWGTARLQFMTADHLGNAWFTESTYNRIACLNPTTNVITRYSIPTPDSDPRGIGADDNGDIWFAERVGNKIAKLDPGTGIITEWPLPIAKSYPMQLSIESGQVCFAESNSIAGCLNSATNEITQWSILGTGLGCTSVIADGAGNMWIQGGSDIAYLTTDNMIRWWDLYNIRSYLSVDNEGNAYIAGKINDAEDPWQIHKLQY